MTQPRIGVHKHNWKVHQNIVHWCHLRVTWPWGLHFYQTRSNVIILYNTLPAVSVEKVVVRKPEEELYSKMCQCLIAPQRIILKLNLNYEHQDTASSNARTSVDQSDKDGGMYRDSCRGEIDSFAKR